MSLIDCCFGLAIARRLRLNLQSVKLSGIVPFELLNLALIEHEFSVA